MLGRTLSSLARCRIRSRLRALTESPYDRRRISHSLCNNKQSLKLATSYVLPTLVLPLLSAIAATISRPGRAETFRHTGILRLRLYLLFAKVEPPSARARTCLCTCARRGGIPGNRKFADRCGCRLLFAECEEKARNSGGGGVRQQKCKQTRRTRVISFCA